MNPQKTRVGCGRSRGGRGGRGGRGRGGRGRGRGRGARNNRTYEYDPPYYGSTNQSARRAQPIPNRFVRQMGMFL